MSTQTVRSLDVGQTALITGVNASGELGRRIREMGLVPGTTVTISGRAPLKDPIALRLSGAGCTISLRNNEADHILVNARQPY